MDLIWKTIGALANYPVPLWLAGLLAFATVLTAIGLRALVVPSKSRLEAANRRLAREVAERERVQLELAHARDQALEVSRLKSAFVANMSHEVRTPLNGIIGFAQLLYDGRVAPASEEYRQSLGNILSSGRHLLHLITGLLDLAQVEAGRMKFASEPVEPAKLVGEVQGVLRSLAAERRIRVEAEVAPGLDQVIVDSAKLKQVLYNYLSNALKFSHEDSSVTIRIGPEDRECFRLEVEDRGEGILAEDIEHLFTEFHQLDSGFSKRHEGTGLGLALTKRIVEAQGGRVGVRSQFGKGSTFWAVLPRSFPIDDEVHAVRL
jgi:signal transduction histidine kinase